MKKEENNAQQQQQPAIVVSNQYIKDMSLEIPHAPEIFKEFNTNPEVSVNVEVNANHLNENFFNVDLKINVEGKLKDKHLFIVELVYSGVVSLSVPQEHLEPVLMIEIPKLLFPFARQIITTNLMNAGLPPFMLNPIDFVAMYQARQKAN